MAEDQWKHATLKPAPTPLTAVQWKDAIESQDADWPLLVGIDYTNHRGERRWRIIAPARDGFHFGSNSFHTEPQWLLTAYEVEKDEDRIFALKDIHAWTTPDYNEHGPKIEAGDAPGTDR